MMKDKKVAKSCFVWTVKNILQAENILMYAA